MRERKPKKEPPAGRSASPLQRQYEEMEAQLDEAEEMLRAIREGEVDAFAVSTPAGSRIFTLEGSDIAYRQLIEAVTEGVLTLTRDGLILFCNMRFARMVGMPTEKVVGSSMFSLVSPSMEQTVRKLIGNPPVSGAKAKIPLMPAGGRPVPVLLSTTPLSGVDTQLVCLVVTRLPVRETTPPPDRVAAGIARELRNPLGEVKIFLSALNEICQRSKVLEPMRKKTANELYSKAISASERIGEVIRRVGTKQGPASRLRK